ncbi:hypothetical protein [Amycolatopsis taiwanensis]|nr:hypothetical protein [Amycolatopsis taiwanensis]
MLPLTDLEPADAGTGSGLFNTPSQLGAAIGGRRARHRVLRRTTRTGR